MPSTIARDLLRTFVLKTNRIWPLSACNRLPYSAAVRLFVRAVRDRPEVASVYLSHGMAGSEWIPGLSDIDWTVILTRGLDAAQEYEFLEWFWNTHDRLKRYFPMLGEVVILDEDEFPLWQIYSSTTSQGRTWMLLHGRETASAISVDAKVWRPRALNAALWVYLESLLPCLSQPDSYVRQQDMARRARKIFRYLGPVVGEDRKPALNSFHDGVDTVAQAVKRLEDGARAVTGVTGTGTNGNGVRGLISTDKERTLMVLDDGLDLSVIRSLVHAKGGADSVPLPYCLFTYLIRHYNPSLYANILQRRTVVSGEDPVPGIDPPERPAFAFYTTERIAYLLPMRRGPELFSTREAFSVQVLESAVNNGLAVLLLRENWVGTVAREHAARLRSAFPESFAALNEIREYVAAGREKDARRAAFHLFRPIAAGMCELLNERETGVF